jgi:hypothetical protein
MRGLCFDWQALSRRFQGVEVAMSNRLNVNEFNLDHGQFKARCLVVAGRKIGYTSSWSGDTCRMIICRKLPGRRLNQHYAGVCFKLNKGSAQ